MVGCRPAAAVLLLTWCLCTTDAALHAGSAVRCRPLTVRCCAARTAEFFAATRADLDMLTVLTVNGLVGELGNDYGFNNNRATAHYDISNEQREDLRSSLAAETCITLKAVAEGQVVGFVRIRPVRESDPCSERGESLVLDNLVVDEKARRQGIAARLVEEVEARLQHGESKELTLWVDEDNVQARAFYQSAGWLEDGLVGATRYRLDWWKGGVVEECKRVTMRRRLL